MDELEARQILVKKLQMRGVGPALIEGACNAFRLNVERGRVSGTSTGITSDYEFSFEPTDDDDIDDIVLQIVSLICDDITELWHCTGPR